ncbi:MULTISPECIES: DNRLRE domain-containing protein [unclassified Streptomyces]|uniref:DNRLRE domain-containing protein n=1 Tax=unclassified Streptomyces TaxID=2593676 RepID=UPI0006F69B40|nr:MULTISPECIES: DNRLRE domain-containing protein [unclassified Streptomyces]KQX50834.1 hypothetical protein ASD33_12425 [Streptomyces sp. Root1304]KRA84999.1 hypothetical protein ASE09_12430 [Streptomyces sp. Root66D1]
MSQEGWRNPGRRVGAAVVAVAIAAGGIAYANLRPVGASGGLNSSLPGNGSEKHGESRVVAQDTAFNLARKTGKPVEITAQRTARSTTWARPDGLTQKKLYASPIWAKSGGDWKPVDTTLHRTNDGWEPKATNTRIVFSAGGSVDRASRKSVRRVSLVRGVSEEPAASTPLITMTVAGTYDIQLTWPGPVPTPIIDGSRALYPEIFPGADLVLTAEDTGFAQLIVLKNRAAAADPHIAQLSYGLMSSNLVFRLDPASGVVAAQTTDGDEVAMSATPMMWDSSGTPAVTDGSVGATAQPSASETPAPSTSTTTSAAPSPTASAEELANDVTDPLAEVLPTATDGPQPTLTESPLPSAPPEPTPAPSQSGSAATLGLALLNGPSPESRGDLVEAELSESNWLLTPNQDFLNDSTTTYPVFIDPSVTKHTQDWTTAYSRFPNATFFNGKDFNKGGSHEARVGFESDTWGTSRSYFNIAFDKTLKGAKIMSAKLSLLETYSWSCSPRSMSVHVTGAISGRTNWKNAPRLHDGNKVASGTFAHGYKTGCRDAYETFDVRAAAQSAADQGKSSVTFGMRARDEDSQYAWKKFQANGENAPALTLVYNRPPTAPTNLDLGPDAKCTTTAPYVRVGAEALTFTARSTDADKNLDRIDFDLWPVGKWATTGDMLKATGTVSVGGDTAAALRTTSGFATSGLVNGTTYSWQVRAIDDAGTTSTYAPAGIPCRFVFDSAAPRPPKVTSVDFPDADSNENAFGNEAEDAKWSKKKFGTPGSFTFRALDTDVVRYEYGFNSSGYPFSLTRTAGTPITTTALLSSAKPPTAGPNVLFVRTIDGAGHVSEPTKYFFYVTPRDQADMPGDFTGDKLPDLLAITSAGNLRLYPSHATADLLKGTGDVDYSMSGAYRYNPDKDPNGDDLPAFIAPASAHFKGALITHNGDFYGGDGLQDMIARVGGKLWVYPGDGYGAVNIDKRREILLPSNAPAPSSLTQIVATSDITGDKLPDMLVKAGPQLWAFVGYTGGAFHEARLLLDTAWDQRDIVMVTDIGGDGVPDLLWRSEDPARGLLLRHGKALAGGGLDLNSIALASTSATGKDEIYGSSGWGSSAIPMIIGTPDLNGDSIPDLWTAMSDGKLYFYAGTRTTHGARVLVGASGWLSHSALG